MSDAKVSSELSTVQRENSKSPSATFGETRSTSSQGNDCLEFDRAREAQVIRKLDWNLMSLFFTLYMLAFLDRGNIGNARIAGMAKELDLSSGMYAWLLTIFYIAYLLAFQVLLWKVFPPHIVGAVVVFGWGLLATVQAAVKSWASLMALRFLLGAFEAAYGPGIVFLLSFFYLRHEIGLRVDIFASAAPIASTFAGALAYGITSGHAHVANWRLLFLVEGIPTVLMGVVTYFYLPDSPEQARFLTEKEKTITRARVLRQVGTSGEDRIGSLNLKELALVIVDLKVWLCGIMYFCGNVSYSSLPVFLPTIIEDMGFNAIDAQGLSAPPSFIAFLCALLTTYVGDRTQQRLLILFVTSLIGGAGYIILATVDTVGVRYFATFLASAGVFSTIPNILVQTMNNQGSDTRRGMSIVLVNLIGQCGPFVGTNIFPLSRAPRYVEGMTICAAFMFFSAIAALVQRFYLSWENSRLDRKHGKVQTEGASCDNNTAGLAVENYGSNYRYTL